MGLNADSGAPGVTLLTSLPSLTLLGLHSGFFQFRRHDGFLNLTELANQASPPDCLSVFLFAVILCNVEVTPLSP